MAIYVDLDGTLAKYEGFKGYAHIGEPVPLMYERVKNWLKQGKIVKIFTARACDHESIPFIQNWLIKHNLVDSNLEPLEVTCIKGYDGVEFWDDRAVAIEANTGQILNK